MVVPWSKLPTVSLYIHAKTFHQDILLCFLSCAQSLIAGWGGRYSFRCQPVDYSNDPIALRMAQGCWWYYISKFMEFTDTIFFVLRKKDDHLTTLHVIHHGCMPMSVWFGVKFTPGKHMQFLSSIYKTQSININFHQIFEFICEILLYKKIIFYSANMWNVN